jgi:hypothetical protein
MNGYNSNTSGSPTIFIHHPITTCGFKRNFGQDTSKKCRVIWMRRTSTYRAKLRSYQCNYTTSFIHSFIHFVVSLTTGPQSLPKPLVYTVPYSISSFNFQYHLVSLTLFSSCLRLLLHLPSITSFRRQFRRKMWPIQLSFLSFHYI